MGRGSYRRAADTLRPLFRLLKPPARSIACTRGLGGGTAPSVMMTFARSCGRGEMMSMAAIRTCRCRCRWRA